MSGRGRFIQIRIIDQHNGYDILFDARARADDVVAVRELFRAAAARGLELDDFL